MLTQMTVIGRACSDPKLIETQSGSFMCRARVATNHTRKGEKRASFWSVVAFGKRAELLAGHLKKGARVAITGPVSQDEWTNREGQKTLSVEIIAEQVTILDWPETLTTSGEPQTTDEAIPF
jgi:single-strand DNA-binding protein